jgi:2-keto-4-pentenoate hydratase/2-oxohepta-3-ene-1,7-dioic acid hydratase in catechol pathway
VNDWLAGGAERAPRSSGRTSRPPIARPSKIVCIGLNFRDHAAESGRTCRPNPVLFFKSTSSLAGPNDAVIIPKGASKLDWEVELALVIGRRAAHVDPTDAISHIADSCCTTTTPSAPFSSSAAASGERQERRYLRADGSLAGDAGRDSRSATTGHVVDRQRRTRQKSTTANMVVNVFSLVSYVSQFMTLLPVM